jgi:hypothetical protein
MGFFLHYKPRIANIFAWAGYIESMQKRGKYWGLLQVRSLIRPDNKSRLVSSVPDCIEYTTSADYGRPLRRTHVNRIKTI